MGRRTGATGRGRLPYRPPNPKSKCSLLDLPKSVSQPALRIIDELLVATVAGCAGEDSAANLTAAVQSRALLAMRYGGALPGAETTAPAQHISSEAAIERFIA